MVTKILKTASIVLVLLTLWACPFEKKIKNAIPFNIPDLISVTPLDTVYHVGDRIVYTAVIPSRIDSLDIDIYEDTGVTSTLIIGSEIYRFDGNVIEVSKGYTRRLGDENTLSAFVIYNPTDKVYEFQARITFTQPGEYRIFLSGINIIFDNKKSEYNAYQIKTSIQNSGSEDMWEFRVVP